MKAQSVSDLSFEELVSYPKVMVVGATDVGKSTFVKNFASFMVERGMRCWVADFDVGQTDIGPVGTLGIAEAEAGFTLLGELEPQFLFFTGYPSPGEDLVSFLMGVRKLALFIRKQAVDRVVFDTTGWVKGYQALQIKLFKMDVIRPNLVILVGEEVWGWQKIVEGLGIDVMLCTPSRFVVAKDAVKRRINRYQATVSYFDDAPLVKVDLTPFVLWGRSFDDVNKRLIGFFDRGFNTVAVGWIQGLKEETLLVKLKTLTGKKPVFFRIGAKIEL